MTTPTSPTFQIKFLPAEDGDAIFIRYGQGDDLHCILIDSGRTSTGDFIQSEIETMPEGQRELELMVVTHIDADHIESIYKMLQEDDPGFTARDTWFNGWHHMENLFREEDTEEFSVRQAELLTRELGEKGWSWNGDFRNQAVVTEGDELPVKELPGGMKITLLSPNRDKLEELKDEWDKKLSALKFELFRPAPPEEGEESFDTGDPDVDMLAAARFKEDKTEENGSSIAFIAEFAGKRVLFSGDAHPTLLRESLEKLSPDGPMELDLLKISHHGSKNNTNIDLLKKVNCKKYAFSSNGRRHHHPDQESVARVIKYGGPEPEILFNYRKPYNEMWDSDSLREKWKYSTQYGDGTLTVDL